MNPESKDIKYEYPPADSKNPSAPLTLELNSPGPEWAKLFRDYISDRTRETFRALQFGGVFRDVAWSPADGVGIKSSRLNFETGAMEREAVQSGETDGSTINWNMTLPYADIWQARRPYLFFANSDIQYATKLASQFFDTTAKSILDLSNDLS